MGLIGVLEELKFFTMVSGVPFVEVMPGRARILKWSAKSLAVGEFFRHEVIRPERYLSMFGLTRLNVMERSQH